MRRYALLALVLTLIGCAWYTKSFVGEPSAQPYCMRGFAGMTSFNVCIEKSEGVPRSSAFGDIFIPEAYLFSELEISGQNGMTFGDICYMALSHNGMVHDKDQTYEVVLECRRLLLQYVTERAGS